MEGLEITYRILKIMKGNFTLKSGKISPIYINLRSLTGQSELFAMMIAEFMKLLNGIDFDIVCGVPHGAVQFSHFLSQFLSKGHIFPRDAAKNYGTKQQIDGKYKSGQKVLLIEDVITTGKSIVELVEILRGHELIVEDVLVFVDRGDQGKENLEKHGLRVRSVFKLSDFQIQ
ncbi:uridine 5'-monophosphate synthase-like isoform X2 [Brevipalpus obovatus]|uniref:uridine 5'-monophosphate synthase-like isoform X2 n=1 Tax=Brevipalpus obovatus TaxID=246614 RepID=UPI003D9DF4F5